jgi:hypothetical protein
VSQDWVLAKVTEVWLFAERKIILADRLHFSGQQMTVFTCNDPDDIIDVDDIVSLSRSSVSILDPVSFSKLVMAAEFWEVPEGNGFSQSGQGYQ